jgi:hypothetical protein
MIHFTTTRLIYRAHPNHEVYLEGMGWTKAKDIPVNARISNHDGTYTTIVSVREVPDTDANKIVGYIEVEVMEPPGVPRGPEHQVAPTLWERLETT